MDKNNIILFALEYLKSHETIDEYALRRFIQYRPEVGVLIPIDDICMALDEMCSLRKINLVFADGEISVYKKGEKHG